MNRHAIPKRLRFDVLERDGFTCRYCGAKPQDGALHIDHIIPVVEGGKTEFDNLITSCEPCNSGKSSRIVTRELQPLPDMCALADQAVRVTAEIRKWRRAHKRREDTVTAAAEQIRAEHEVSVPLKILRRAILEFGIAEVDKAADITAERIDRERFEAQTSYLFGVLRHRRDDEAEAAPMPTYVKPAPVVQGGCPFGYPGSCPSGNENACIFRRGDHYVACDILLNGAGGWDADRAGETMYMAASFTRCWRRDPIKTILNVLCRMDHEPSEAADEAS